MSPVPTRLRMPSTSLIIRETVGGGIDIAFNGRDDAVVVRVDARHLSGIRIEQPPLKILHPRLKGHRPRINVQIDLVGKTARDAPLAKFPLRIHRTVKFVGIARKGRIVADDLGLIHDSARSGTRNDRL